jgi:hypothetical protein
MGVIHGAIFDLVPRSPLAVLAALAPPRRKIDFKEIKGEFLENLISANWSY